MTARIIDGKAIAAELRGKVAEAAARLARDRSLVPGLAVVLVGSNPASEIYVGSKTKLAAGIGMRSFDHRLPETASEFAYATRANRRRFFLSPTGFETPMVKNQKQFHIRAF